MCINEQRLHPIPLTYFAPSCCPPRPPSVIEYILRLAAFKCGVRCDKVDPHSTHFVMLHDLCMFRIVVHLSLDPVSERLFVGILRTPQRPFPVLYNERLDHREPVESRRRHISSFDSKSAACDASKAGPRLTDLVRLHDMCTDRVIMHLCADPSPKSLLVLILRVPRRPFPLLCNERLDH